MVYTKEAVYFAFPFAMDHPEFRYEIQNGYVNPARDIMKSGNKEWFSVQHWVAVDQNDVTAAIVPVDAYLVNAWATSFAGPGPRNSAIGRGLSFPT